MLTVNYQNVRDVFVREFLAVFQQINQSPTKFFFREKAEEQQGFTTSSYFVTTPNRLQHYVLKQDLSPTEAILDLMNNPATQMALACQGSVTVALYLAIYRTLLTFLGPESAKEVYDALFLNNLEMPEFDSNAGSPLFLGRPGFMVHGKTYTLLHPLYYFMETRAHADSSKEAAKQALNVGDIAIFDNHLQYIARHPTGTNRRYMVVCTRNDTSGPKFAGFGLGNAEKSEVSVADIEKVLINDFNRAPSGITIFFQQATNQSIQSIDRVPGFNPAFTRCFNYALMLQLLQTPEQTCAQYHEFMSKERQLCQKLASTFPIVNREERATLEGKRKQYNDAGVKLFGSNDFSGAQRQFVLAIAYTSCLYSRCQPKDGVNLAFDIAVLHRNLGRCHESLGEVGVAYAHFKQAQALLVLVEDLSTNPQKGQTLMAKLHADYLRLGFHEEPMMATHKQVVSERRTVIS